MKSHQRPGSRIRGFRAPGARDVSPRERTGAGRDPATLERGAALGAWVTALLRRSAETEPPVSLEKGLRGHKEPT